MAPGPGAGPIGKLSLKVKSASVGGLALLSVGHFMSDVYASLIVTLLPVWIHLFDLPFTAAGFLVFMRGAGMAVFEPAGGYVADRTTMLLFPLGLLIVALSMSAVGLAPSFAVLIVLVLLGTIGQSLFGPQAASQAGLSSSTFRGLGLAIFLAGGSFGSAFGPVIVAALVHKAGLANTWLTAVPGLLLAALLQLMFGFRTTREHKADSSSGPLVVVCSRPALALAGVLLLRGAADTSIVSFLPMLVEQKGGGLIVVGTTVSIFKLSGAVGSVIGGVLSDRRTWKPYTLLSFVLAAILLYGVLQADGWAALVLVALLGAILLSSTAYTLVLAQDLLPEQTSTATGLTFSLGLLGGGLGTLGEGLLADRLGVQTALLIVGVTLSLGAAAATCGITDRANAMQTH